MILKNLLYSFAFLTVPIYVISEKESLEINLDEEGNDKTSEEDGGIHVDLIDRLKGKIDFFNPIWCVLLAPNTSFYLLSNK